MLYVKSLIGVNPLTGKAISTTRRGFKKKKDVIQALARIKFEVDKGAFRKQRAEIYNEIYELWIKQYERTVEESTFIKTKGIFRNHRLQAIGDYKVTKMDHDVCQKHVNEWADKLKKFRIVKFYNLH